MGDVFGAGGVLCVRVRVSLFSRALRGSNVEAHRCPYFIFWKSCFAPPPGEGKHMLMERRPLHLQTQYLEARYSLGRMFS